MREQSLRRPRRAVCAAVIATAIASAPYSASAEICDLKVYDASFGVAGDEADTVFERNEQFIVCFTPLSDGYVSLWDRIPQNGPVERLSPSPKFEKAKARPVQANQTQCFGDGTVVEEGAQGYVLLMEAKDGLGLGRMWLVFSESLDDHPDEQAFDSASLFKRSYERRFGAGSMAVEPGADRPEQPQPTGCTAAGSLDYFYRVVAEQGGE